MRQGLSEGRIPISGPWITEREIRYVTDAVTNAWYSNHAVYHQRFEQAFQRYVGVKHAIALPSCTSAIHLALLALGIGPGDEVVVPDVTWIASAAPVTYVGATTVFADIDPLTWCLSAQSLEACITPRTKAVIPVDLYGGMPDWEALRRVAETHDIAIVEDAAESIGSRYRGRPAGSFGRLGVFSFHGSKTVTTGEGGMLVTDSEALYARAQVLRDHGRPPGDRMFRNNEVAWKYKMSALQAALGLAQIERVDELVERKRAIFGWYRERLQRMPSLTLNAEPSGTLNSYWMVTAVWPAALGICTEELMRRLEQDGIDTRPFFHPLSSLPAYAAEPEAQSARMRNRTSYDLHDRAINLPSALSLTEAQVERVCGALIKALGLR